MAQYLCLLISASFMFSLAFIALLMGISLPGWYYAENRRSEHFSTNWYTGPSSDADATEDDQKYNRYVKAIYGTLLTSMTLTSLCFISSLLLLWADVSGHVHKWMTVLPKITALHAIFAGLLAYVACTLLLVLIHKVELGPSDNKTRLLPSYCFYIVAAAACLLLLGGCCHRFIKFSTKVDCLEKAKTSDSLQGFQAPQNTRMNPSGSNASETKTPWRIFVSSTSTQTASLGDMKKAAEA
ncbi:hypothetical protein Bpfe_016951 [Biomphalaria pfeifferi]|uniref:Uncharacterized protein n=1 Tax=Biomphalaria pfeifferi TaxID=112525 RepID=A0AAD8BG22_BIOPF|nr:hypothetical protein Bpfe_016951 [Biomphalaria pfeifferi]